MLALYPVRVLNLLHTQSQVWSMIQLFVFYYKIWCINSIPPLLTKKRTINLRQFESKFIDPTSNKVALTLFNDWLVERLCHRRKLLLAMTQKIQNLKLIDQKVKSLKPTLYKNKKI